MVAEHSLSRKKPFNRQRQSDITHIQCVKSAKPGAKESSENQRAIPEWTSCEVSVRGGGKVKVIGQTGMCQIEDRPRQDAGNDGGGE